MFRKTLFLAALAIPTNLVADQMYLCNGTYQTTVCDLNEEQTKIDTPSISTYDSEEITQSLSSPFAKGSTSETSNQSERAQYSFQERQGENSNEEENFSRIERQIEEFDSESDRLIDKKGKPAIRARASALLIEVKLLCTKELLERSFTYKSRCQDLKRALSNLQQDTKLLD